MKCLLFILLVIGYSVKGQQSTKEPGDSIWLTSDDTAKVKVYKEPPEKYDTIGGWHLVSDTAKGRWNPVSAMYLHEVRIYKNRYMQIIKDKFTAIGGEPVHFQWLDGNKKPIKIKVWP